MFPAVREGTKGTLNGAGCGVELGISFPFFAGPPSAFFRGEAALSKGLREAALPEPHDALVDAILRRLPGCVPSRAYAGNETCERLIPSPGTLGKWLSASSSAGWGLSLVLPPLGLEGQARAMECLPVLSDAPDAEVVVNDWGTVHLLRSRHPDLRIVLGRLTHKMLRDPRLAEFFDSPEAPPAARSALVGSGERAAGFRVLMERYGIGRREVDPFLQSAETTEWEGRSEKLSLHLPYLFVTMGRFCLPGALGRERGGMFVPGSSCESECRRHAIEFQLPTPGVDGPGKGLLALGNGFYHAVSRQVSERLLAFLPTQRSVDRIILTLPATKAVPR